jgi:hypothetical protein
MPRVVALVILGVALMPTERLPAAGSEPPAWAYAIPIAAAGATEAPAALPDTSIKKIPGSTFSFTRQQIVDGFGPADWFPGDHPAMPIDFGGGLPYDIKSKATTDNAHFLKFTPDGKFLLQIGKFGMGSEGSNSTTFLGQPTDVYVDPQTNEAYITDGYTNRRLIVVDANTGAYKRHWGAYGKRPDDTPMAAFNRSGPPRQ